MMHDLKIMPLNKFNICPCAICYAKLDTKVSSIHTTILQRKIFLNEKYITLSDNTIFYFVREIFTDLGFPLR